MPDSRVLPARQAQPASGTSAPVPPDSVDSLAGRALRKDRKDPAPGPPAALLWEWVPTWASALSLHFSLGRKDTAPPSGPTSSPGPTRLPGPRTEAFGPLDPDPTQPSVFLCLWGRGGKDAVWFNV